MKTLKYFVAIFIITVLLIVIAIELFYRYTIYEIQPVKIEAKKEYSTFVKDVLLASQGEVKAIGITPFSSTEFFIYYASKTLFNRTYNSKKLRPKGATLSFTIGTDLAFKKSESKFHGHKGQIALSIWASNNYSTDEGLNYVLEFSSFGFKQYGLQEASDFYFKKDLETLNYSEVILLISSINVYSLNNPYCKKSIFNRKAALIDKKLKKFKPSVYSKYTYQFPILHDNNITCK